MQPSCVAKRPRETDRRAELLPTILRHCELHSSHIGLQDIAAFLESDEVSAEYYDAHSAEEISHHIASIWAAKLLLQVGSGSSASSGVHTAHRQRVDLRAGVAASARVAVATGVLHSAGDDAAPCSPQPASDEGERSCEDMDSASDVETMRHTDGADARVDLHIDVGHGDLADGDDGELDAGLAGEFYGGGKGSKQSRRLVWTDDLHRRFEEAVAKLGSENAKPQAIQQLMNVEGITTRNIKSHLQKYRLRLHKQPSHSGSLSAHLSQRTASAPPASLSSGAPRPSSSSAIPSAEPSPRQSHAAARGLHTPSATPTAASHPAPPSPPTFASAGCCLASPPAFPAPQSSGYELTQVLSNTSMQSKILEMMQQQRPAGFMSWPDAARA
ncbi:hypothetical protein KFE25_010646 [Diacronema lutheri]|nr:hypothetical protein KFE25_010646 [Diacronema lutheri]